MIRIEDNAGNTTRVRAKDGSGRTVSFDFDANRYEQIRDYVMVNKGILGYGAGGQFGKHKASDATEAQAFLVSQMAWVETQTFEKKYQPRMWETLLPGCIDYSAGPWAQTIEYQIVDSAGMGKFISDRGSDIPYVDTAIARKNFNVALAGIGYDYTTEELRIASYLQRALPVTKQQAAMNGFLDHLNLIALQGYAGKNFQGLFNNSAVTAASRPSGAPWATTATADQIIADFGYGIAAVQTATANNTMVTMFACPLLAYQGLMKPRSTTSDTSVLEWLNKAYPSVKIVPVVELASYGNGRGVFYAPNNDNMVLHVPLPLQFAAPQLDNLRTKVPGEYKLGGLEIRRTPTLYYMNGLNS